MVHYLSQSLSIGAHVSQNNQDVFLTLVCQELCRSKGQTRSDDTLNTMGEQRTNYTSTNTLPVQINFTSGTKQLRIVTANETRDWVKVLILDMIHR